MSALEDALDHAAHGRQVVWLGIDHSHVSVDAAEARATIVYRYPPDLVKTVVRSNGRQSITFASGGRIRFGSVSAPNALRGISAAVVYLPHWRFTQDWEFMENLLAVLGAEPDPRIGVVA